jgi:hypothetical protein
MRNAPEQPADEAFQVNLLERYDGLPSPDGCDITLMPILKRQNVGGFVDFGGNELASVPANLFRRRSDPGHRRSFAHRQRGVPYRENTLKARNAQEFIDRQAARAVSLSAQPRNRRRSPDAAAHRTQSEEIRDPSDMEIPSMSHETTECFVITSTPMVSREVRA